VTAKKTLLSIGFSRHLKTRNYLGRVFNVLPHCSGILSHGYCEPVAWWRWGWHGRRLPLRTLTGANPLPVYMGSVYPIRTGVGWGVLRRRCLFEGIFSCWSEPATNPHGIILLVCNLSQWGVEPCRLRRGLSSVARWDLTRLAPGGPFAWWTGSPEWFIVILRFIFHLKVLFSY
jgi:hypothetical protein